jgi:hypothetical protein
MLKPAVFEKAVEQQIVTGKPYNYYLIYLLFNYIRNVAIQPSAPLIGFRPQPT